MKLNTMRSAGRLVLISAILLNFTACTPNNPTPMTDNTPAKPAVKIDKELQAKAPQKGDTVAILETNKGKISIRFFPEQVPETVKNFIELSKAGKYDGVKFHRVINNFMIQGGDIEGKNGRGGYSYKGPGTKLIDEFDPSLSNIRGAISMANAGPNTGGSQFFIIQNKAGEKRLDNKHAVFGQVYEGMDVVDKIAAVETDGNDAPVKPVVINKVTIKTF